MALAAASLACNLKLRPAPNELPPLPATITPAREPGPAPVGPTATLEAQPTSPTSQDASVTPTASATGESQDQADLALIGLQVDAAGDLHFELKNNGPDPLEQGYFFLTTSVTGSGPSTGVLGPMRMWVKLNAGGTVTLKANRQLDFSQGALTVEASIRADDFDDPNTANNARSQTFSGQSAASPTPPLLVVTTMLPITSADLEVIAVQGLGAGTTMKVGVRNNGTSNLNGVPGNFACFVTKVPKGGGVAIQDAASNTVNLNLASGQSVYLETGITVDGTTHDNQISCSVSSDAFDPVTNNNDYYTTHP